VEKRSIYR